MIDKKRFLAFFLCFGLAGPAVAATLSQERSISLDTGFDGRQEASCSATRDDETCAFSRSFALSFGDLAFEAFDPSLGTLNSVTISSRFGSGFLRVTETGDSCTVLVGSAVPSVCGSGTFDTIGFGRARLFAFEGSTQSVSVTDPQGGNNTFLGGQRAEQTLTPTEYDALVQGMTLTLTPQLDVLLSGGVECDKLSTILSGAARRICDGGLRVRFVDGGTSTNTIRPTVFMTVTYDFEPAPDMPAVIPLPAGLPLLLAGLGALGLVRRRG